MTDTWPFPTSAQSAGSGLLADLVNKGEVLQRMLREPRVFAAMHHVLGDFRVNSLNLQTAALKELASAPKARSRPVARAWLWFSTPTHDRLSAARRFLLAI